MFLWNFYLECGYIDSNSMCVGESTMFQFGERHPVLFEIVLVIAAFLAAGFFRWWARFSMCTPR